MEAIAGKKRLFLVVIFCMASMATAAEKVAFSFEDPSELESWKLQGGATAQTISRGATHGSNLLKLELPAGSEKWPGMNLPISPGSWLEDWSAFDSLKFDVTNPTSMQMGEVIVGLYDRSDGKQQYVSQNFVSIPPKTSMTVCLPLATLSANSRTLNGKPVSGESFDFTHVKELIICVDGLPERGELYIDNIRFGVGAPPRIMRAYTRAPSFSPNNDGWLDSTSIFAEFTKSAAWRLQIINMQDKKIARTWTGRANCLDVDWDATDSDKQLLPSGDYCAEITVYNSSDRKTISDKKDMLIKVLREHDPPRYMVWPASSMVKILRDDPAGIHSISSVELKAAKNETASFQVGIRVAGELLKDIRIEPSCLVASDGNKIDKSNITIYREKYINIKALSISRPGVKDGNWWPDGLIPVGKPFSLTSKDGNCVLWVDIKVPGDTTAGNYKGGIKIVPINASPVNLNINLKVWNFMIPEASSLPSAFGMDYLTPAHGNQWRLYADLLRKHRLMFFRSGLNFDDLEPYVTDKRVLAYRAPVNFVGRDAPSKEKVDGIVDTLTKLRQRGGPWMNKHYVYCNDEPRPKDLPILADFYKELKSKVKGVRILLTKQPEKELYGLVDIWCPYMNTLDLDVIRERQMAGDSVWWYHMPFPLYPFPTYQIDADSASVRIIPWMTAFWGLQGLLYWEVSQEYCAWEKSIKSNVWDDPNHNGDGILIYPGDPIGLDKPVPSLRLKLLRDGMEDYEYLQLLRKLVNKKASLESGKDIKLSPGDWSDPGMQELRKYLQNLIVSKSEFARENESFEQVKEKIAKKIEKLQLELNVRSLSNKK